MGCRPWCAETCVLETGRSDHTRSRYFEGPQLNPKGTIDQGIGLGHNRRKVRVPLPGQVGSPFKDASILAPFSHEHYKRNILLPFNGI